MKPKGLAFSLIALCLAISTRPMSGQTTSFFRQFTTPGIDRATAVAADASGIYVVGYGQSPQSLFDRAGVRKYDPLGNVLWTRELAASTPEGSTFLVGVAAHATGVYVLGTVYDEWFVRKYSPGGTELWSRQLEYASGELAVDAGGVYVLGDRGYPSSGYFRKYDHEGTELWTSPSPSGEHPWRVTTGAEGVYVLAVAERTEGFLPDELVVRKYDARGNPLWTRPWSTRERPSVGLASDASGVYVVSSLGNREFRGTVEREYSLRKYDAAGNELWTRQLDKFYSIRSIAVTADATGVYIAGYWEFVHALPGQCASGSGGDSILSKFDRDGAELWTRRFGAPDSTASAGVAVDASSVYVVGREGTAMFLEGRGLLAPPNNSSGAFFAKFEKTAPAVTGTGPRIFPGCVVNAASYVGGGVAPGEIVTLFGSAMGPSELVPLRLTGDRRLASALADTRILFDGVPAPLLYVSDKQSSAIVPYGVTGRSSADVQVEYKGVRSEVVTVPVLASRPGIFSLDGSGGGQGAILNEDGSLNSPSNPALRGSIITLYATGGGEAAPGVEDGQILGSVLPRTILPVKAVFDVVFFDDMGKYISDIKPGEVLYAGGVSGSVAGLLQVNVRVPANLLATGNAVPFVLVIGSHWTVHQVTIALRQDAKL